MRTQRLPGSRAHTRQRPRDLRRRRLQAGGFSLMELMVVVAIIGMINGLTIAFSSNDWQRERVNAAALGLVGWLEEVRASALRETSDNPAAGGCVVSISTLSNAASGDVLASVSPPAAPPRPVWCCLV